MMSSYVVKVLIVGLGGFIGSGARYALSGLVHRLPFLGTFPHGTLVVNVVGCCRQPSAVPLFSVCGMAPAC